MFRHTNPRLLNTLMLTFLFYLPYSVVKAEERCETPAASLQSSNGSVAWRSNNTTDWAKAQRDQVFCTGDSIRVESQRAALRLANSTVVRLKEKTLITLLPEETSIWLELKQGAAHFLTRTPKQFTVKAPYLNAAVDGTEFVVSAATTQNEVLVFEGQVTTSNNLGTLILTDGMRAFSNSSSAPQLGTKIRLQDSVEWVLYYPALYIDTPTSRKINTLIEQQQYPQAIEALQSSNESGPNSDVLQASLALAIGQNTRAKNLLENTLVRNPSDADARALQVLMLLVEGHAQQAITESKRLIEEHPNKISAQHARSYALQSKGEIESALVLAEQAYKASDNSAYAAGRYAELSLSAGKTRSAKKILKRALEVYPHNSRLNALAGFVELNQLASKQALVFFNQAVEYNSEDSLSYLGQALALIQQGKLEQGRQQMELAVLLDPSSSLLRSYLGKTYFEGNHNDWSATQYQLAKTLDPNDPTPWFYEAHLRMEQNRLPEALSLITTAIEKNDNRAVYRSRLLLDSDTAARSANQAGIYQQLGFDDLAKNTAALATANTPTDFAAHQALTLAYSKDPKAHHVRADEALLTKLYQPIGAKALNVGVGTVGIQALPWLSPSEIGLNEYSSLFTEKGLSGNLSIFQGTQDSKGYEVQGQITEKSLSLDAGQYKHQTNGFRDNNYLNEEISEVGAHYQVLDSLKLFAQRSKREHTSGDLIHGINREEFDDTRLQVKNWETNEFGGNLNVSANSKVILHSTEVRTSSFISTVYYDEDYVLTTRVTSKKNTSKQELSYLYRSTAFKAQVGQRHIKSRSFGEIREIDEWGEYVTPTSKYYSQNKSYIHLLLPIGQQLEASIGGAYSKHTDKGATTDQSKSSNEYRLGAIWHPLAHDNLKINVNRWKTSTQQNTFFGSLEPSHVFFSPLNPESGFADRTYGSTVKGIWEYGNISGAIQFSKTKTFELINDFEQGATISTPLGIRFLNAALYYQLNNNTSVSTLLESYRYDRNQGNTFFSSSISPSNLDKISSELQVTTQLSQQLSLSLNIQHINQKENYPQISDSKVNSKFPLLNSELTIMLPRKAGKIKVSGHNILNRNVPIYQGQIQLAGESINPVAAEYSMKRSLNIIYSTNL